MNVLTWMLFGISIGFFVHLFDNMPVRTMPYALFLGSAGGITGGMTAALLFGITVSNVSFVAFTTALSTSVLLLSVLRSKSVEKPLMRKEKYVR